MALPASQSASRNGLGERDWPGSSAALRGWPSSMELDERSRSEARGLPRWGSGQRIAPFSTAGARRHIPQRGIASKAERKRGGRSSPGRPHGWGGKRGFVPCKGPLGADFNRAGRSREPARSSRPPLELTRPRLEVREFEIDRLQFFLGCAAITASVRTVLMKQSLFGLGDPSPSSTHGAEITPSSDFTQGRLLHRSPLPDWRSFAGNRVARPKKRRLALRNPLPNRGEEGRIGVP